MEKTSLKIKIVAFTVEDDKLALFLKRDSNKQFCLPWGKLEEKETPEIAVKGIVKKDLDYSLKDEYIEQLYTFSTIRDSNTYIDIVYFILIVALRFKKELLPSFYQVRKTKVKSVNDQEIIDYALQRLSWKLEYTNVVYSLMPVEFTLSELQKTYQAIFGRELDKRNFRRKILSLKLLEKTGKEKRGEIARPATLYRFKQKTPVIVKVFS